MSRPPVASIFGDPFKLPLRKQWSEPYEPDKIRMERFTLGNLDTLEEFDILSAQFRIINATTELSQDSRVGIPGEVKRLENCRIRMLHSQYPMIASGGMFR